MQKRNGQRHSGSRSGSGSSRHLLLCSCRCLLTVGYPAGKLMGLIAAANVHLVNLEGKPYWTKPQAEGDWMVGGTAVNWFGPDSPESILIYGRTNGQAAQLFDGEGKLVLEFPMRFLPELSKEDLANDDPYRNVRNFYALTADIWGDSREEVILFGARGLCVYTNPRPLELPTLYNETLYLGR